MCSGSLASMYNALVQRTHSSWAVKIFSCLHRYELGRVAHCIAATMASLASNAECAAVLMASDAQHGAVAALMLLARVHDHNCQQSGHVRAAAACALSFLACHNIGARGDECLTGPYREALLQQGALVRHYIVQRLYMRTPASFF
jgi:hypothetical protein